MNVPNSPFFVKFIVRWQKSAGPYRTEQRSSAFEDSPPPFRSFQGSVILRQISKRFRSEEDTMSDTRTLLRGAAIAAITLILTFAALASAADILDDWAKVQPPPPPELKPLTLDGATTAFLILDMVPPQCD